MAGTARLSWRTRLASTFGPDSRIERRPALVGAAVAAALALAYLLSPLMGTDLSAQIAHADFARHHPSTPVDLRWFGGTLPLGYSLWVPYVTAWIGVRLVGAIAAVAATYLIARMFQQAGARRPTLGAVAAACCQAASLVEGRIAFAAATVFGLGALRDLARGNRARASLWSLIAGAGNPVVALLLWLCAGVAFLQRRLASAVILAAPAAIGVAVVSGVFGDGGSEPFGRSDAVHALLATVFVLVVVPGRYRQLRLGALLAVVMVLAAYEIHTPVGSNATRLSLLFAIPVVLAFARWGPVLTALAVVVAILVQPPLTFGTLKDAGSPATRASYYTPLISEIEDAGVHGRVEIPEMIGHWDSAYVARDLPLARGWLRQVDTQLNDDVFYTHGPTVTSYRSWLQQNAVQYVAIPDARLAAFGKREATLIKGKLPYLKQIWHNGNWTLYSVDDYTPIVESPATLVSYTADSVSVRALANSTVELNLRWFTWLSTADGACIAEDGSHVQLRTTTAGTYTVSSRLLSTDRNHC